MARVLSPINLQQARKIDFVSLCSGCNGLGDWGNQNQLVRGYPIELAIFSPVSMNAPLSLHVTENG